MDTLIDGLGVTLVGMLVVFAGLVILIIVINMLKRTAGKPRTEATAVAVPEPGAAPAPLVQDAQDGALVAVIAAAIAAVWQQDPLPQQPQGFVVRRIRRI